MWVKYHHFYSLGEKAELKNFACGYKSSYCQKSDWNLNSGHAVSTPCCLFQLIKWNLDPNYGLVYCPCNQREVLSYVMKGLHCNTVDCQMHMWFCGSVPSSVNGPLCFCRPGLSSLVITKLYFLVCWQYQVLSRSMLSYWDFQGSSHEHDFLRLSLGWRKCLSG